MPAPSDLSSLCSDICRNATGRTLVRAGGIEYRVPLTTPVVGRAMVADISRFRPGESVQILGNEGCDVRAEVLL